jgi:hypothetical protein
MARLAREGSHSLRIRQLAVDLTNSLPSKDFEGETYAIFNYVKGVTRYVHDIRDIDTLHEAATILDIKAGDCDDMSILLAALLLAIGHELQFIALSQHPPQWSHVWLRDLTSGKPLDLDATEALPFGQHVPYGPGSKVMTYDVDALPSLFA